ncbi:MAG: amphi-Trp domain-containing protein [Armatimonadetes bacterium]|nr:amphi-Trp domain-containing protein [Armatimonadota bacterium]
MARRDVERVLTNIEFAATLRDLAESIEQEKPFAIAVNGIMIVPPLDATFSVEYERGEDEEELEFQLKWAPRTQPDQAEKPENGEGADALS